MKHPNEEELILYHYEESPEAGAIEAHLAGCAVCRTELRTLRRLLSAVDTFVPPERSELYGAEVWRRLRPRLPERTPSRWLWLLRPQRLVAAGAIAALVLVAFLTGRFWSHPESPLAPVSQTERQRILWLEIGDHLDRSQRVLLEIANGDLQEGSSVTAIQNRARELVSPNRIYRHAAAEAGDATMAMLLEDLERVLLEAANAPSDPSSGGLEGMRRQISEQEILFKMRVISGQLREREKAAVRELARRSL